MNDFLANYPIDSIKRNTDQIHSIMISSDEFCKLEPVERSNLFHFVSELKELFITPEQSPEPEQS